MIYIMSLERRASKPLAAMPMHRASCEACHAIGGDSASLYSKPPSFSAIVNQEGLTAETCFPDCGDAHNYPVDMGLLLDSSKVDDLMSPTCPH